MSPWLCFWLCLHAGRRSPDTHHWGRTLHINATYFPIKKPIVVLLFLLHSSTVHLWNPGRSLREELLQLQDWWWITAGLCSCLGIRRYVYCLWLCCVVFQTQTDSQAGGRLYDVLWPHSISQWEFRGFFFLFFCTLVYLQSSPSQSKHQWFQ